MGFVASSPNVVAGDVVILGGSVTLDNDQGFQGKDAGGTVRNLIKCATTNKIQVASNPTQFEIKSNNNALLQNGQEFGPTFAPFAVALVNMGATPNIVEGEGFNVITDLGTGRARLQFVTARASANYGALITVQDSVAGNGFIANVTARNTGTMEFQVKDDAGALTYKTVLVAAFDAW